MNRAEEVESGLIRWRRGWRIRRREPTREWCDENLRLSNRVAYQAGPWNTMAFPYEAGIFWLWQHPRVEELYMQWGTRLGKTVMIPALIAWAAANDPGPALIGCAERDSARTFAEQKMYPMLEDCLAIKNLLLPEHQRAFPIIDLRHMLAYMAWSGSASALAEKSIRYAFLTELDKWSVDASREADPEVLALERTKDWPNRKILKEGTPTLEGLSRIEANLKQADVVLQYHVPCPHCLGYQVLHFEGGVKWDKVDGKSVPRVARETAYYECAHCHERVRDAHRYGMLRRGVWAPADVEIKEKPNAPVVWGPAGPGRRVGTQLSSLYSPTLSWGEMAETFLRYQSDQRKLQDWVNSWEGKTWRIVMGRPEWDKIGRRLATTTPRSIAPSWTRWITAGVDVHKWKNVYVVIAWAPGPRCQIIECGEILEGGTEKERIINAGHAVLDRAWSIDGASEQAVVRLACFDSGYATGDVYDLVNAYGIMRARAIKGSAGPSTARAPWIMSTVQADPTTGKRAEHGGQRIFHLDTAYWQGVVNSMLMRDAGEPGALLLHEAPDEDFLRRLCNVAPVPVRDRRGKEKLEYRVIEQELGDHVHDATCYAVAAADMLGIRMIKDQMAQQSVSAPQKPKQESSRREERGGARWMIGRE